MGCVLASHANGSAGFEDLLPPAFDDRAHGYNAVHDQFQESHITSQSQWLFRPISNDEFLTVRVKGTFIADDTQMLHQAAVDGEGIALLPVWWVEDDLVEGSLVPLLQDWVADIVVQPRGIYLVHPAMDYTPSKVSAFVAFMKGVVRPKASARYFRTANDSRIGND
jgi:DNA-binding transcriptional LysR family regulator